MMQAIDYDNQLSRVHALLTEWGEWSRGGRPHLWYPSRNPIHRMMVEGINGAGTRSSKIGADEPNEDIKEMERAVLGLPESDRWIVDQIYLMRTPVVVFARIVRLPVDEIHIQLNALYRRLADRLGVGDACRVF